jgi:hypothetical protein
LHKLMRLNVIYNILPVIYLCVNYARVVYRGIN